MQEPRWTEEGAEPNVEVSSRAQLTKAAIKVSSWNAPDSFGLRFVTTVGGRFCRANALRTGKVGPCRTAENRSKAGNKNLTQFLTGFLAESEGELGSFGSGFGEVGDTVGDLGYKVPPCQLLADTAYTPRPPIIVVTLCTTETPFVFSGPPIGVRIASLRRANM